MCSTQKKIAPSVDPGGYDQIMVAASVHASNYQCWILPKLLRPLPKTSLALLVKGFRVHIPSIPRVSTLINDVSPASGVWVQRQSEGLPVLPDRQRQWRFLQSRGETETGKAICRARRGEQGDSIAS